MEPGERSPSRAGAREGQKGALSPYIARVSALCIFLDGVDGPRSPASMCHKLVVGERHKREEPSPIYVSIIGLDLAKHWFQIHGIDAAGNVVIRRRLRRAELEHEPSWSIEVVNSSGTSIVWDDLFLSDEDALAEFQHTVAEEGIKTFLNRGNVIPFKR